MFFCFFFLNLLRKRRQVLKEFKFGGMGRKKTIKGDKKASSSFYAKKKDKKNNKKGAVIVKYGGK